MVTIIAHEPLGRLTWVDTDRKVDSQTGSLRRELWTAATQKYFLIQKIFFIFYCLKRYSVKKRAKHMFPYGRAFLNL